jgi:hypothetical protein
VKTIIIGLTAFALSGCATSGWLSVIDLHLTYKSPEIRKMEKERAEAVHEQELKLIRQGFQPVKPGV